MDYSRRLQQMSGRYNPDNLPFQEQREFSNETIDDGQCTTYLNTHSTIEKLQYAQSQGASIPETYYLLGIVYNHPLHDISSESSKQLGMKLDNPSLMNMIRSLWPK